MAFHSRQVDASWSVSSLFFSSQLFRNIHLPHSTVFCSTASLVHTPLLAIKKGCRSMRFPSIPTLIRTFSLYNLTSGVRNLPPAAAYKGVHQSSFVKGVAVWSMPTIPFLGALFGQGQRRDMTDYPLKKGENQWEAQLTPDQFRIVRQKQTEAPYAGRFDKEFHQDGTYVRTLTCTPNTTNSPVVKGLHR